MSNRQGISSRALDGVERLDKERYLAAYLREQQAHIKHYAVEGRALVSSWSPQTAKASDRTTKKNNPNHGTVQATGFDTPILKPRAAQRIEQIAKRRHKTAAESSKTGDQKKNALKNKSLAASSPSELPIKPPDRSANKIRDAGKVLSMKRPSDSTTEYDEQIARLAERRERKRAKRAIVQLPDSPEEINKQESARNKSNVQKSKSNKRDTKNKMPPGFALMYGLTATNVGANRLTVKPPINLGVFSKGKASAKTSAAAKSVNKVRRNNTFSEHNFLNKLKKQTIKQVTDDDSSSTISDDESYSDATFISNPKHELQKNGRKMKIANKDSFKGLPKTLQSSPCKSSVHESSDPFKINQNSQPQVAESIIWDIEREDACTLASGPRSESNAIEASVVVDAQKLQSLINCQCDRAQSNLLGGKQANAPIPNADMDLVASSLSLRPSESASQAGLHEARNEMLTTTSKYFAQLLSGDANKLAVEATKAPSCGKLMVTSDSRNCVQTEGTTQTLLPIMVKEIDRISREEPIAEDLFLQKDFSDLDPPAITNYLQSGPSNLDQAVETTSTSLALHADGVQTLAFEPSSIYTSVHADFYEQIGGDSLSNEIFDAEPSHDFKNAIQLAVPTSDTQTVVSFTMEPPYMSIPSENDPGLWYSATKPQFLSQLDYGQIDPGPQFARSPWPPGDDSEDFLWEWEKASCMDFDGIKMLDVAQEGFEATSDEYFELSSGDLDHIAEREPPIVSHPSIPLSETISEELYEVYPVESQDDCVSEVSTTRTDGLVAPQRFYQGRALLLGLSKPGASSVWPDMGNSEPLSSAEKDVVKLLKGHWLPQKF